MFDDETFEQKNETTEEPADAVNDSAEETLAQPEELQPADEGTQEAGEPSLNEEVEEEPVEMEAEGEPVEFVELAKETPSTGSYEYVFSDGAQNDADVRVKKQRRKKEKTKKSGFGAFVAVVCISVAACVLLSFFAGLIGYRVFGNNSGTSLLPGKSSGEISGGNASIKPNATVILEKAERTGSEYGSAGTEVFAESQVVRMVHDAVVVIEATVQSYDFFGRTAEGTSSGSGVVISADGYILTCNHVVNGASSVLVRLNDGTEYNAALVGADATSDLAVLKVDAENMVYAKQGCSADLVAGEHVIAIGNPLGTLGGTVTNGIISATERSITTEDGTVMTLIQTDAAINSGNSGGGLFNLSGQLIGIVNAKYASSGIEGLAFAIPVDSAFEVEQDLIQYGYVRGVIDDGLTTVDITESNLSSYRYRYGITKAGLYIVESKYCMDLQNKDRIISMDGKTVNTTDEWNNNLKDYKVGDTITILAERDGREFTTQLTLREYVPNSALR